MTLSVIALMRSPLTLATLLVVLPVNHPAEAWNAWLPISAHLARAAVPRRSPLLSSLVAPKDDGDSSSSPAPPGSVFRLVYKCKICETRNMVKVQKKAWEEGTVISICQGCNNKHLVADAAGLVNKDVEGGGLKSSYQI